MDGGDINYSPCEVEFGDIADRETDIEVGRYLENRIVAGDYRDSGRMGDRAHFRTFAKSNLDRRRHGKMAADKEARIAFTISYV